MDLETLTIRYGREIFGRLERPTPLPFGPAWWDERLMEWSMGDEAIKVQLFRFVDVLPLLRRTFGEFAAPERANIAAAVRRLGHGVPDPASPDDALDAGQAAAALRTVAAIPGGAR